MTFVEAITNLREAGYYYYGKLAISGYDFDAPDGERLLLTENQVIELAESL